MAKSPAPPSALIPILRRRGRAYARQWRKRWQHGYYIFEPGGRATGWIADLDEPWRFKPGTLALSVMGDDLRIAVAGNERAGAREWQALEEHSRRDAEAQSEEADQTDLISNQPFNHSTI